MLPAMPITDIREINEDTFLGFWSITETTQELTDLLKKVRPEQEIRTFKNENRQREWLASRILAYLLLQDFTSENFLLQSDENGKPVFPETDFQISISQSGGEVAVIVSSCYEVGIDIEIIREKVMQLATKFLSEKEQAFANADVARTCLYWSAKETLYKLYSRKKLLFKENLGLGPINELESGVLDGSITLQDFNKNYAVHYEKNNNFILTYCLA